MSVHAESAQPSLVMVLGGKTLLWRENGIVFLRPSQAAAFPNARGSQGTVSSSSFLELLHLRLPALSARDHLFTGRCDLVIPPLSRGPPTNTEQEDVEEEEEEEDDGSRVSGAGNRPKGVDVAP